MLGKDYRVLEAIGVGGMAVVYLVEHQTLLKQFAAKVLSLALASSLEARARFAQEAHAASQLDHENIVSITDFGVTVDHRPFFVMELLRGQTLDQRLAEGAMSIEEAVAVSVPVARALSHAHAEGVIHLDVKPENIFLVQRSQRRWGVKVVDFGISKTPLSTGLTKLGETAGSPLFMAPEMCRGDDHIDQRADVYSFGILLYLMLCGRLPFLDDSVHRVLEMQLDQPPPPPREVNTELSPALAAVVERALAKAPEDRYPTIAALMHDFEAALPPGADRLLIEAATGTTMGGTPFAGALAGLDSMRIQRASQPSPVVPARATPPRRWLPIAGVTAVAGVVIAVLLWRQLRDPGATPPAAQARAAAPAHVEPAAPAIAVAPEPSAPSAAVAADPPVIETPAVAETAAVTAMPRAPAVAVPARPGAAVRVAPRTPGAVRPAVRPPAGSAVGSAQPAAVEPPASDVAITPPPPAAPELPTIDPEPVAAPAPPPVAAPVPVGSLDATPSVASLDVKGSLSPAIVRRSVERALTSLQTCYRAAARANRATPALELRLTFEIDENNLPTHVQASGASFGSLASCATGVAGQLRTQQAPDVGTAQVTVVIGFRPT